MTPIKTIEALEKKSRGEGRMPRIESIGKALRALGYHCYFSGGQLEVVKERGSWDRLLEFNNWHWTYYYNTDSIAREVMKLITPRIPTNKQYDRFLLEDYHDNGCPMCGQGGIGSDPHEEPPKGRGGTSKTRLFGWRVRICWKCHRKRTDERMSKKERAKLTRLVEDTMPKKYFQWKRSYV